MPLTPFLVQFAATEDVMGRVYFGFKCMFKGLFDWQIRELQMNQYGKSLTTSLLYVVRVSKLKVLMTIAVAVGFSANHGYCGGIEYFVSPNNYKIVSPLISRHLWVFETAFSIKKKSELNTPLVKY